jgi:hypothetical protein
MNRPSFYDWEMSCEIRIEEIKTELSELESYPETPELRKEIEKLETELCLTYESLNDYKGRIQCYEYDEVDF